MNSSHKATKLLLLALLINLSASCSNDEAEFTGILDHRPEGKDGMWVINGQSFSVTDSVELDEDNGPLTAGTCVELEMEDGDVKDIESEKMEKCQPVKK